jgi:HK97 family phage prohead protease
MMTRIPARLSRRAAPGMTPDGFQPGQTITRALDIRPGSYDAETRSVIATITTGAAVRRFGIIEEMSVEPGAIDLRRAAEGRMALLFNHDQDRPLGNVREVFFRDGAPMARLTFADTPEGRDFEGRVSRGEISQVSIGYRVTSWTLRTVENDVETWRADKWELYEVSLVTVPADPGAVIRSAPAPAAAPAASQQEIDDMRRNASPAPGAPAVENNEIETRTAAAPAAAPAPAPSPSPATPPEATAIERRRAADILAHGQRFGVSSEVTQRAIADGTSYEAYCRAAVDAAAQDQARSQPAASHVRVERDETETRRRAMEDALVRGIGLARNDAEPNEATREYLGRSLVSLAAERLGVRHAVESFAAREEVLRRAMHTTSDFPILLENAINRSLAPSYDLAPQTYREISIREDFNDFRPHTTVTVGDFPMLQPINEAGEIRFGTFGEKKETVAVASYGIGLNLSRQLVVNDNLSGLARVIANYGQSVALFEEKTAYGVLALNSGAGPALLEGAANMFTAGRGNLAGSGTAITVAAIGAARAAMRKFKSIDGNELLYNAPRLLLIGPDKETEAEQLLTSIAAATNATAVPASMRSLRPLVSQMLTGNGWYLFCETSTRSNFRWGLLSGYQAPRVRTEEPFGRQGVQMSVEHDFGIGGIDWRAGYRNPGN